MRFLRLSFALALAGILFGCKINPYEPRNPPASVPPATTEPGTQTQAAPPPEPATPIPGAPAPTPRPKTLTPASKALVAQAQTQLNSGNDAMAAATIERALRIEPDNPLLWIELAKVRQDSGNPAQAENLARKALSKSQGDPKAQAAAWRVIAESYRARGRNPEAREADAKAQSFD